MPDVLLRPRKPVARGKDRFGARWQRRAPSATGQGAARPTRRRFKRDADAALFKDDHGGAGFIARRKARSRLDRDSQQHQLVVALLADGSPYPSVSTATPGTESSASPWRASTHSPSRAALSASTGTSMIKNRRTIDVSLD